jgi:hypothetical protein
MHGAGHHAWLWLALILEKYLKYFPELTLKIFIA